MALPVYERNNATLQQSRQADVNREQPRGPFILNPKPGRTSFRVMPAYDEKGTWFHEFREHSFFSGGKAATPFVCIKETQGRCPICEYGQALYAGGREEESSKFRSKLQYFLNTLVFSDSSGKNTIKNGIIAMQVGVTVKSALLHYDFDVQGGYGDITNYETGFDMNMDKEGMALKTKYTVTAYPQRNSVLERLANEGIEADSLNLFALDQLRPELSYDDLVVAFEATLNTPSAPVAAKAPVATPVRPAASPTAVGVTAKPIGPTIGGLKIAPPLLPGKK